MHDTKSFTTSMPYIARDVRYEKEKAYAADFPVDDFEGAEPTNHIFEDTIVTIHDVKSLEDFSLDVHGFCFLNAKSFLTAHEALTRTNEVEAAYYAEVEALLEKHFPEYSRFESMDFIVRKRDPRFPSKEIATVTHEQPAGVPHSDFSVHGAFLQLQTSFPGQDHHFKDSHYDMLNVWRPLIGPNDDWPLALCDFQTVDLDKDIILNDAVHRERVGENWLLHRNERHRWYYKSKQQPEDIIVFRNVDSAGKRARAFHAAVFNAGAVGEPRQSVEVRVVAFR